MLRDFSHYQSQRCAHRGTRKKKHAVRKRTQHKSEQGKTVKLVLLATLFAGGFVSFLLYLNQVDSSQATAVVPQPQAAQQTPTEELTFYDELPSSEVIVSDVDAYRDLEREQTRYNYLLQAGSFRSADDADRLRARLLLMGLEPTVV